ncbi:MAG: ABC transporter permease [Cellulomonadaceae bacterium]
MITAIQIEYRKFVTTRMWWVLLLLMAAYMAFLAGVFAFTTSLGEESGLTGDPVTRATSIYTVAVSIGYVFPVLVGVLSVAGEFRHKTITPTLLAEPNRSRVLVAKLLGSVPVGLLYGVVGTLTGVLVGGVVLSLTGSDPMLSDPQVWRAIALSVLALTVWTAVGVGVGSMLTNQIAAIVVVLAFTQFVEPMVRSLLTAAFDGSLAGVASYLPGAAGEAIVGSSIYAMLGVGHLLSWWQGALVLLAYALVLTALARATSFRRDIG